MDTADAGSIIVDVCWNALTIAPIVAAAMWFQLRSWRRLPWVNILLLSLGWAVFFKALASLELTGWRHTLAMMPGFFILIFLTNHPRVTGKER